MDVSTLIDNFVRIESIKINQFNLMQGLKLNGTHENILKISADFINTVREKKKILISTVSSFKAHQSLQSHLV